MSAITRSRFGSIRIVLGDDHVGDLVVHADDRTEFSLSRDYLALYPRPVLGQLFEDDLRATHRARMQLPPWFSNLLWEDRIREVIAAQIGVSPQREAHLLAYLGDDLPGGLRAIPEGDLPAVSSAETVPREEGLAHPIKFSLAGAQPKLSMLREGRGLTFPATGRGGNFIVKLPGSKFAGVPENEALTMTWARESGITVPEFSLEPVASLRNMPPELQGDPGNAFSAKRFDRPMPGKRIHIEDFAQVIGVYPTFAGKYRKASYETIGRILLQLHPPSFDEFLRRLVFVILSANADAHLKNWSLWYPDRVHAELAPAYDLVSTIEFIEKDELGLNLAQSKKWTDAGLRSFESLAVRVGADPGNVARLVKEAVARTLDAWPRVRGSASPILVARLADHWKRVPLASLGT